MQAFARPLNRRTVPPHEPRLPMASNAANSPANASATVGDGSQDVVVLPNPFSPEELARTLGRPQPPSKPSPSPKPSPAKAPATSPKEPKNHRPRAPSNNNKKTATASTSAAPDPRPKKKARNATTKPPAPNVALPDLPPTAFDTDAQTVEENLRLKSLLHKRQQDMEELKNKVDGLEAKNKQLEAKNKRVRQEAVGVCKEVKKHIIAVIERARAREGDETPRKGGLKPSSRIAK